jgi:polyisoprenyl-phosphate glycosyltransferase
VLKSSIKTKLCIFEKTLLMQEVCLYIVVPCFNEEEVLLMTHETLVKEINALKLRGLISGRSGICYVDDGSIDNTWSVISNLANNESSVKGVRLSNNCGHQNALLAGMKFSRKYADVVVTIDADLQDDVSVISQMIEKYREGVKVVYGVRKGRRTDSFFKRWTAQLFYRLLGFMKVKTIYNHADFRLIDKKVLIELENYKEVNLFLRGIFPLMGFKSACVYYERKERAAGITKYPLSKMFAFAWDGITSFSIFPLRIVLILGILVFLLSLGLIIWALGPVISGRALPGWASIVIPTFFFAGLQMISIGFIGEYVGKIYREVKSRPRFIIDETIGEEA